MALNTEEANKIKDHLLKQLTNFPEDRREEMRKQVESMTAEEVENFVKQSQLTHLGDQCIVCAIAARQVQSFDIGEDNENLAVLELNPLSKGHTILFPKKHTGEITSKTKNLTELVAKNLMSHFSPQKVQTKETKIMGHKVVEIIPLYGTEAERKQAHPDELAAVKESLSQPINREEPPIQKSKPEPRVLPKIKPRIP